MLQPKALQQQYLHVVRCVRVVLTSGPCISETYIHACTNTCSCYTVAMLTFDFDNYCLLPIVYCKIRKHILQTWCKMNIKSVKSYTVTWMPKRNTAKSGVRKLHMCYLWLAYKPFGIGRAASSYWFAYTIWVLFCWQKRIETLTTFMMGRSRWCHEIMTPWDYRGLKSEIINAKLSTK